MLGVAPLLVHMTWTSHFSATDDGVQLGPAASRPSVDGRLEHLKVLISTRAMAEHGLTSIQPLLNCSLQIASARTSTAFNNGLVPGSISIIRARSAQAIPS